MRIDKVIIVIMLICLLLQLSCETPIEPVQTKDTYVRGKVLERRTNQAIPGAYVFDVSGAPSDTADSNGNYDLLYSISEKYTGQIKATYPGYNADTVLTTITLEPGKNIEKNLFLIWPDTTKPPVIVTSKGQAASIVLISTSTNNISIQGTGLNENAMLVFEVRDSLGVPLGPSNRASVRFRLQGNPNGGEYLKPTEALTDPSTGRVTTAIMSGKKPGVLQIYAETKVDSSKTSTPAYITIKSNAAVITISGGLPVKSHMSIAAEKLNIAGGVYNNLRNKITVNLGDKDGNPVPLGTAVYFTANSGYIQPSAVTNVDGVATVELISANPRPDSLRGRVSVFATTVGDSGITIKDTITTLFSSWTMISVPRGKFSIPDQGTVRINYRVGDIYGNPLVSGSSIKVKAEGPGAGDIELSGNSSYTFVDQFDTLGTFFTVYVSDKKAGGVTGDVIVSIEVTSPNGNFSDAVFGSVRSDSGAVIDPGTIEGGESGFIWSLSPLSVSATQLSIRGSGSNETSRITFFARDSVGKALTANRKAYVSFALSPNDTSFGTLSPTADYTDETGIVGTTFTTANKTGTIQIIASATVSGRTVISTPVQLSITSRLVSPNHFTVWTDKLNYPGRVGTSSQLGTVYVRVGDRFGNPPPQPVTLNFSSTGGMITSSATTDATGAASAVFYGGKPYPTRGVNTITVSTFGEGGSISQSTNVLFSGTPIVTFVNVPNNFIQIPDGGKYTVQYRVADTDSIPPASGSKIDVTYSGTAASEVTLSGQTSVTLGDDIDRTRVYSFSISDDRPGEGLGGDLEFTISVSGPNGTASKKFYATLEGGSTKPRSSGYAASLTLTNITNTNISVRGTGQNEATRLTFVAKDSAGNPVTLDHRAYVSFQVVGPGGGLYITPLGDSTNQAGEVSATLGAGDSAGVVQVIATTLRRSGAVITSVITVKPKSAQLKNNRIRAFDVPSLAAPGDTIKSAPVQITISSGLASINRFIVWSDKLNYPALTAQATEVGTVNVRVGDRYGNPVQKNTAIAFAVNIGTITPSAETDESGFAKATLYGGFTQLFDGNVYVTASTIGEGGRINKVLKLLYTGAPQIKVLNVPTDTVRLLDGQRTAVNFSVADTNSNPVSAGTTITVAATGAASSEVTLSGHINVTTKDDTTKASTLYSFEVADAQAGAGSGGIFIITITVAGPNGNAVKKFYGTIGPAIAPSSGFAHTIEVSKVTETQISVRGTNQIETSKITFVVKDSVGNPITLDRRAYVRLTVSGGKGGLTVSPTADSTDKNGLVTITVNAGDSACVVDIIPYITGTKSIIGPTTRISVFGSLPDAAHYTAALSRLNMPGLISTSNVGTVSVSLGDKFGNPVRTGTSVTFTSTGGMIDANAQTDASGQATANIRGGNPIPIRAGRDTGFGMVTVQTFGVGGVPLTKQLPFLFTGPPKIAYANIANPSTDTIKVSDGGQFAVYFWVTDTLRNPLCGGTTISVTIGGNASGELNLLGTTNLTLVDDTTRLTSPYSFTVIDTKSGTGTGGTFDITISVSGPNGNLVKKLNGLLSAAPPPSSGVAYSISNTYISSTQLTVRNSGLTERSRLNFIVRDSLGAAVTLSRRAYVEFSVAGGKGGVTLAPTADSTDKNGEVSTLVTSGDSACVIEVTPIIRARNIIGTPIQISISGSLPDPARFTATLSKLNMPGLVSTSTLGTVSVQLNDKFGNPVRIGTPVTFKTTGGAVDFNASTDASGQASVNIRGGNPIPIRSGVDTGYGTITVETFGVNGVPLTKLLPFLFTGPPRIQFANVPNPPADIIRVEDGGQYTVYYWVTDTLGHPLSSGTTVSVTVSGSASSEVVLSGQTNLTLGDDTTKPSTPYSFIVSDPQAGKGSGGSLLFTVSVSGPNGTTSKQFRGTLDAPTGSTPSSSGYASSIELVSVSNSQVSVRGTGKNETSTLLFVVKDSLGNSITLDRKVGLSFSIRPSLGGGEFVKPILDSTNAQGKVTTVFNSGTKAGVVQITASTTVSGRTITSEPVTIAITSALPDSAHMTVNISKRNLPGLVTTGELATVGVQLGDKFGNPVANHPLSFGTNGGLVDGVAKTDEKGATSVKLYGGLPVPNTPSLGGVGFGYVTVQTVGENGDSLATRVPFLFTGSPRVTLVNVPTDTVNIADGGSSVVRFWITDTLNHPLSSGATATVSVSGSVASDLQLDGNTSITFGDDTTRPTIPYSFIVSDTKAGSGSGGNVTFTISVSGPNGITSKRFYGTLAAPPTTQPPSSGYASSIELVSVSNSQVSVRGTGRNETSTLIFVVKDSLGNAITSDRKVRINFSIRPTLGGTEYITPSYDSTNAQGRVTVAFNSGTKTGVIQITASTTVSGRTISSEPVSIAIASALPDSTHMTIGISPLNMPGLSVAGQLGTISVQLGDKFGNPVANHLLSFKTTGGLIDAVAKTSESGFASVNLYGGKPEPSTAEYGGAGWGYVTMQTVGESGDSLARRIPFLFSGAPTITVINPADTITVLDGQTTTVTYKIEDKNGNPIAGGHTVTIDKMGEAASEVTFGSTTSFTLADDTVRGRTRTFTVSDAQTGQGEGGSVLYSIVVSGPTGTYTKLIPGRVGAPGDVSVIPPTARQAAQIAFISVSAQNISVSGVGGLENSVITYEVRDSLGKPIDGARRVLANFEVQFFANSRWANGTPPMVIPPSDSSDDQGRLRTSIVSGTQAGLLQVLARINMPDGRIIRSEPVRVSIFGGFPDSSHFTLSTSNYTYGRAVSSTFPQFTVLVGDTFSNPVAQNTAVYFQTQSGVIQTGFPAYTDINGSATVNFLGGNPLPENLPFYTSTYGKGYFWVTSQTQGRANKWIQDSVLVYESIPPIQVTAPDSITIPQHGTSTYDTLIVTDGRGKPLPFGTSIAAKVNFVSTASGVAFEMAGDIPATMPNVGEARFTGRYYTTYLFGVTDVSTSATSGMSVVVQIDISTPFGTRTVKIPGRIQ